MWRDMEMGVLIRDCDYYVWYVGDTEMGLPGPYVELCGECGDIFQIYGY